MPEAIIYREAEKSKMREYKARINEVEQGDFTPLIFTTTGGMGPQCERALKKLTERMAEKRELPTSVVAGWLRSVLFRSSPYFSDLFARHKKKRL